MGNPKKPSASPPAPNPFQATEFIMSCAQLSQLPDPAPEVAFAGRSNAGKSSALNALCAQKQLARVSKTPGRTQLLNFFDVPRLGRLVDLPGYGYAAVPGRVRGGWGALIGGYVEGRGCLRGIVLIMDSRHPLTDFDVQMISWAQSQSRPIHVLLTKSDKLTFSAKKQLLAEMKRELPGVGLQLFSAVTREGVEDAREVVVSLLRSPGPGETSA